jgi:hypothetical protein
MERGRMCRIVSAWLERTKWNPKAVFHVRALCCGTEVLWALNPRVKLNFSVCDQPYCKCQKSAILILA